MGLCDSMVQIDKLNSFMGEALVKPELIEEWRTFVKTNSKPGSMGIAVVEATLSAMNALSEGKAPIAADIALERHGITEGMATQAAAKIAYFHSRGEEFMAYWNRSYGGTGKENGIVATDVIQIGVTARDGGNRARQLRK